MEDLEDDHAADDNQSLGLQYLTDDDVEMDQFEDALDSLPPSSPTKPTLPLPIAQNKLIIAAEAHLANLRDAEQNAHRKAKADQTAIQEQALDVLRNLITGASASGTTEATKMIEYLFTTIGKQRFFDMIAAKLRPKVIRSSPGRGTPSQSKTEDKSSSTGGETRVIPPAPSIITTATFILVNIAASIPQHRQYVIEQTNLLKLLVQQFFHPNVEVRTALCYLVTNLTWVDDSMDTRACQERANELRKLGFLAKIEVLEGADPELNVRQRAKCAVWQMKQ